MRVHRTPKRTPIPTVHARASSTRDVVSDPPSSISRCSGVAVSPRIRDRAALMTTLTGLVGGEALEPGGHRHHRHRHADEANVSGKMMGKVAALTASALRTVIPISA